MSSSAQAGEVRGFNHEVSQGERFKFGKNWKRFLTVLDEERIAQAERSLVEKLGESALKDKSFLDIGSGSGLFSLAARRLGARVHSFDYDPQSTACTAELKHRYFPGDLNWTVEQGSILDYDYVREIGSFDVVYSWGVLHHTGAMWAALENAHTLVRPGGQLYIAIYNDQGGASRRWRFVKRLYNKSPAPLRFLAVLVLGGYWEVRMAAISLIRLKNPLPFVRWAEKKKSRGMSTWYDLVDWIGGFPFEVAKPDEIFDFYRKKDFVLEQLKTDGGLGCNEFVFRKVPSQA